MTFIEQRLKWLMELRKHGGWKGGWTMTKFNEGWWNCFCSFANELASVSSSASMVIRAVLEGAGVTKKEVDDIIKSQHLDKRVVEELKEYRAKL